MTIESKKSVGNWACLCIPKGPIIFQTKPRPVRLTGIPTTMAHTHMDYIYTRTSTKGQRDEESRLISVRAIRPSAERIHDNGVKRDVPFQNRKAVMEAIAKGCMIDGDFIYFEDFTRLGCGQSGIDAVAWLVDRGCTVVFEAHNLFINKRNIQGARATIAKLAEVSEDEIMAMRARERPEPSALLSLIKAYRKQRADEVAVERERLNGFGGKVKEAVVMYREGLSLRQIAEFQGVSHGMVRKRLVKAGEACRPRATKNKTYTMGVLMTPTMERKWLKERNPDLYVG